MVKKKEPANFHVTLVSLRMSQLSAMITDMALIRNWNQELSGVRERKRLEKQSGQRKVAGERRWPEKDSGWRKKWPEKETSGLSFWVFWVPKKDS
jgi:hypothetical protein